MKKSIPLDIQSLIAEIRAQQKLSMSNQTQVVANTLAGERDHFQISFVNTGDTETTLINGINVLIEAIAKDSAMAERVLIYLSRRHGDKAREIQKQWELQASLQRAAQPIPSKDYAGPWSGPNPPYLGTPLSVSQISQQAKAIAASPSSFMDKPGNWDPSILKGLED